MPSSAIPWALVTWMSYTTFTGGQPYLTRLAFYRLGPATEMPFQDLARSAAEDDGPFGEHLRAKLTQLQRRPTLASAMARLVRRGVPPDEGDYYRLHAAGLAQRRERPHHPDQSGLCPFPRPCAAGMNSRLTLQAGGTLNPRRHVYIERPEDAELFRLLRAGEYVNVLTPRQMGKSSLMARTRLALNKEGVRAASTDIAAELDSEEEAQAWFRGLIGSFARELDLALDVGAWWQEHAGDTAGQRLQRFFREAVGAEISLPVPIVVFLDEIDSTLKHAFTDGLFTAIRGMYNERGLVPAYERVTFCLLGRRHP